MWTLKLLRGGAVPLLCGGASSCFALYTTKVWDAAEQWRRLELPSSFERAQSTAHALELQKHAAGCVTLTLVSAASTVEAAIDYTHYRTLSEEQVAHFFASRTPFFARPTVICIAATSLLGSVALAGGAHFLSPQRPAIRPLQPRPENEAYSARVRRTTVSIAASSNVELSNHDQDHKLRCAAWAKMLAACEQSNTPKTRFHCDTQLERWRSACANLSGD
jgi:hypothetical protein